MAVPTIQELFDLGGKVALVTGGTGHLGTAFGQALHWQHENQEHSCSQSHFNYLFSQAAPALSAGSV